jgi:hypothetical protein
MTNGTGGWNKAALGDEVLKRSKFTSNIGQEFLFTTRDRVELNLLKFQGALKSRSDWHAPAGTLATLIATLVAAQFRQALGLTSDVWQAMFVIATVAVGVWLVTTVVRAWKMRAVTIESVVDRLCEESGSLEPPNTAPNAAAALPAYRLPGGSGQRGNRSTG